MAKFTVNPTRFDPYKNFKFRVKWGANGYVAGVSKVSALKRTTEMVEHREGGDPSSSHQAPADQREKEMSLKDFRRNLVIDVFNEAGQKVISYKVYRAWVSEFTAQADLDANANAVLIQSIKIEHEGWERDTSVKEPSEPQFDDAGV